ncbi:MAG: hypothetical protein ACD_15C00026G0006 [uncultured bacterium]|nr:MAG: hypothetical protein ACD_15C00026G0006 [uncultured bacterium]HCU70305.1 hypothetical protein [Candidatus Moranbacteria bacterium]
MDIIDKFQINPTNEFHILRHFEFVDDAYKKTLIGKPYWYYDYSKKKFIASHISKNDVEHALETIGTKFYKNIPGIENPKKILELIREKFMTFNLNNEAHWTAEKEDKHFVFTFEYDFAVGDKNVVSIKSLADDDKKNVKKVFRSKCAGESNIAVNTVSGIELQSANMIYVEIFETKQLPFFVITSFPDCLASAIPDDELVFVV